MATPAQQPHATAIPAAAEPLPTKPDAAMIEELKLSDNDIDSQGIYANFTPIAALNLPDWRNTEKQLVRRLDWTLIPCELTASRTLWFLYGTNYLDRTNIAQARLSSLDKDLNLTGTDFSSAVSILTAGYMIGQIPSNMILTRVRPSLYLPTLALIWSGVSAATARTTNASNLMAVRFVLGLLEAPFFSGAMYITSCWYTRRELATRTAIIISGMLVAPCVSGLLAAGVFSGLEGAGGLAGWQWLFIIEALMGALVGLVAFFSLPDYPHSKTGSPRWSMTQEMRDLAQARILADRVTGSEGESKVLRGLMLAIKDPKTWCFILMNYSFTCGYGYNFFFPTLINGLGMGTRITSLLMTSPPYVFGAALSIAVSWHSDRVRSRTWHCFACLLLAIIGYALTLGTTSHGARYAATFFYAPGAFTANSIMYSWALSSLGQMREKRAAGSAIVNVLGHLGNICSPYFFFERERPQYRTAFLILLVFIAVGASVVWGRGRGWAGKTGSSKGWRRRGGRPLCR